MRNQGSEETAATIEIENIGGIDHSSVELRPGITVLSGRNATNRTSFLQAIMAVTGSEKATLKADSDEGAIELELEGEKYSRTLTRHDGRVSMGGNPYLDDPMLADLFAFLLETNECRQAVTRDDDLREIIMRPVDTDEIKSEIRDLESEEDRLGERLSELDELNSRLPPLEEKKQSLRNRIEEKEIQLEEEREELKSADKSIEESRTENEELDSRVAQLQETRKDVQSVRKDIASEQESIDALQDELADQRAAFEERSPVSDDRITDMEREMQRLRGQVEAIDRTNNELQSVIQFNDSFLDGGQPSVIEQLQPDAESPDRKLTDELVPEEDSVTCWTCGTDVATEQIESNLDALRSLRQQKLQDRNSLKQEIRRLESEKKELEEEQRRYRQLQRSVDRTEAEIADREETLRSQKEREEELSTRVTQLEADIEELQKDDRSEILEIQEEVNRLEFELDDLKGELSDVEDEIASIEDQVDEREEIEARREEIRGELDDLRTRVEQLQEQAITEFNDHMDAVLDLLDYDNLERIWIDRTQETVRDGRRNVERERFDLHVVRGTDSGTVYEDSVAHLSESEREVTGLVFALAGYLVHEVYRTVPFMLLDSIEAIDADRIAALVDYLEGYADYLVVALLTEDAAALDDRHSHVTSI